MTLLESLEDARVRLVRLVRAEGQGTLPEADFRYQVLLILVSLVTVLDRLVD